MVGELKGWNILLPPASTFGVERGGVPTRRPHIPQFLISAPLPPRITEDGKLLREDSTAVTDEEIVMRRQVWLL